RRALGEVLGVAAAIYLGAWLLGWSPRWPPSNQENRFFLILLPVVILVEIAGAFPKFPQSLIWALRLVIAIGAARVLLHGSVHLKGTEPPTWTALEAVQWLAGLALALRAVWLLLSGGNRRVPVPGAALMLGLTAVAATALLAQYYAYLNGSMIGLPL